LGQYLDVPNQDLIGVSLPVDSTHSITVLLPHLGAILLHKLSTPTIFKGCKRLFYNV